MDYITDRLWKRGWRFPITTKLLKKRDAVRKHLGIEPPESSSVTSTESSKE